MASRYSIEAVFRAIDQFSGPIKRMTGGIRGLVASTSASVKQLDAVTNSVGRGLRNLGVLTAAAAVPVGMAVANVVGAGADFEQAITNVGAVSLMTRDQIADLEKKALELGATTKFSATEVANGMELMGKAGFTNQQILEGIGGVLAAAAADGAELAETSGHISNVLKGMGLEVTDATTGLSNATRVADVLTLASARTNSSIGSLGESMANVSSTARQFKIPLEDTVASVALLQDVGLDASEAGSAVNTMLTKLAAPTKEVSAQMKKMGVTFQDAKGNMLPLGEVMAQLDKAAKKSGGNMDQVAFFADLVGLRGQKAAANLKDLFASGKMSSLTTELRGAAGSAEKMAKLRMNTFRGDIEELGGAVETVKINLFNLESGPLRGVVQGMTEWVSKNQELIVGGVQDFIKDVRDNLPKIVDTMERLGRAALPILAVAAGIKAIAFATKLWTLALAANPATLWIIGLTAAAALIMAFWPEITEGASKAWSAITDTAKRVASAVGGFLSAAFDKVKGFLLGVIEFYVGAWTLILSPLMPIVTRVVDVIKTVFNAAVEFLKMIWAPISAFFVSLWDSVTSAFSTAWQALIIVAGGIFEELKAVWAPIADFFSGLWDGIAATFQIVFGGVIEKIMAAVAFLRGIGKGTLGAFGVDTGTDTAPVDAAGVSGPQVTSKGDRLVERLESVSESRNTLTIQDQSGRAKLEKPKAAARAGITLQPSGAF